MNKNLALKPQPILASNEFRDEVWRGLSSRPKTLPCRFFYDARGSELFEQITKLPEYYPTRTELAMLANNGPEIASEMPAGSMVVEFGSGSCEKTELLLRALDRPAAYVPIEISASALFPAARRIQKLFPRIAVYPVLGGFDDLSALRLPLGNHPRVGFFPGSTIGNMAGDEASSFLRNVRKFLGPDAAFLIGADLKKPLDILLPAYDDSQGITAAFNLNILTRINHELDGTFDLNGFVHDARYNQEKGRIEMHLRALHSQCATVAGKNFSFDKGETIHTESSHKYSVTEFQSLAHASGWRVTQTFVDQKKLFSIHILV